MGERGPLAGSRKREAPTAIRFDPKLKARLEAAAKAAGRSFSREVCLRLEASFGSLEFKDPRTQRLAGIVVGAMDTIQTVEAHAWHEKRRSWRFAKDAMIEAINWFEPDGDDEVADDHPALQIYRANGFSVEAIWEAKRQLHENSQLGVMAVRDAIARLEKTDGLAREMLESSEAGRAHQALMHEGDVITLGQILGAPKPIPEGDEQ